MQQTSLIDELENAVRTGSAENRVRTLRRVTDLFLHDANRLNDEQIRVFDDVLCHLVAKIEKTALIELGSRLAPVNNSPIGVTKRLALHDEAVVAAPVLTRSNRLTTSDLVEIARSKGQGHLLAISQRETLDPALTDVLLDRGDQKVVSSLATNAGARFSEGGFNTLVKRAEGDDNLQQVVGLRADLPGNLLRELLRRASEAVRAKILALVPAERREQIEEAIAKVTKSISKKTAHDYSYAEVYVDRLQAAGELNEAALVRLVAEQRQDELIVALARLASTPIKVVADLLNGHRSDAVLLPCKAAQLCWPTVKSILEKRVAGQLAAGKIIEVAQRDYEKLTIGTAQRMLRFMNVHETAQ
jgi:uncharacterized protein (DUF2336 family)